MADDGLDTVTVEQPRLRARNPGDVYGFDNPNQDPGTPGSDAFQLPLGGIINLLPTGSTLETVTVETPKLPGLGFGTLADFSVFALAGLGSVALGVYLAEQNQPRRVVPDIPDIDPLTGLLREVLVPAPRTIGYVDPLPDLLELEVEAMPAPAGPSRPSDVGDLLGYDPNPNPYRRFPPRTPGVGDFFGTDFQYRPAPAPKNPTNRGTITLDPLLSDPYDLQLPDLVARPITSPRPVALPDFGIGPNPFGAPAVRPGTSPTPGTGLDPLSLFGFDTPAFAGPTLGPLTGSNPRGVPLEDPFLAPPQAGNCNCTETKKKPRKRKGREKCYKGTYHETTNNLFKSPKEEVPCQSSRKTPASPRAPRVRYSRGLPSRSPAPVR